MIYAPAITSIKCLIGTYVLHVYIIARTYVPIRHFIDVIGTYVLHVYIIARTYVRVKPHLLLLHDFPYPLLLLGLPYNICGRYPNLRFPIMQKHGKVMDHVSRLL